MGEYFWLTNLDLSLKKKTQLTDFDGPDFEIYANGGNEWGIELVFNKSEYYTSFAYTTVTYEDQFE